MTTQETRQKYAEDWITRMLAVEGLQAQCDRIQETLNAAKRGMEQAEANLSNQAGVNYKQPKRVIPVKGGFVLVTYYDGGNRVTVEFITDAEPLKAARKRTTEEGDD